MSSVGFGVRPVDRGGPSSLVAGQELLVVKERVETRRRVSAVGDGVTSVCPAVALGCAGQDGLYLFVAAGLRGTPGVRVPLTRVERRLPLVRESVPLLESARFPIGNSVVATMGCPALSRLSHYSSLVDLVECTAGCAWPPMDRTGEPVRPARVALVPQ